jgi:hypothetical protein
MFWWQKMRFSEDKIKSSKVVKWSLKKENGTKIIHLKWRRGK